MSALIHCDGLTKRFGKVSAIDNLHLDVPEGSIYALLGPNGAGKTTLIKMLINILHPSAGRALVFGTDSRSIAPRELAQIGYVSENQDLPEWMTVDYFLAYLKPFYRTWDDALAKELIREFDLPRDRPLSKLSRGMKMKVALASSLAYHPRLLLLDEPFSGLDALVRDEFIQGLLERAAGTTILVSSHDLAELESFASHIGFLESGRMQLSEEATVLSARFREIEVTLREPPTLPPSWPASWIRLQMSAAMVRFVETQFNEKRTSAALSNFFPGAVDVSINPMSLREIFVALAQASRKAAA